MPVSQSCAVAKSENSGGPLDNQTWCWPPQNRTHLTALWPMEQSSTFDCPVARNVSIKVKVRSSKFKLVPIPCQEAMTNLQLTPVQETLGQAQIHWIEKPRDFIILQWSLQTVEAKRFVRFISLKS